MIITWRGIECTYWILFTYGMTRSLWISHCMLPYWLKQADRGELDEFWMDRKNRGITPIHVPMNFWVALTSFWNWRRDYRAWH